MLNALKRLSEGGLLRNVWPWPVRLSWLDIGWQTERSPVWFLVGVQAWVVGLVTSQACLGDSQSMFLFHIDISSSPLPSLSFSLKDNNNKIKFKMCEATIKDQGNICKHTKRFCIQSSSELPKFLFLFKETKTENHGRCITSVERG